ncbi:hypothetical protein [Streptomyces netropsis]|uniref:Uncharacterized protein n=1 Tax=Streptomyces netropsis TaxID=55404 RepID=A0A7W7LBM3_STRNE|nr:hypothetical protein [Streptomyces netropsis]MBB4887229.1 hypothetical protein [Streptomyces netropsis]GGR08791.1 hypothetical protein GCM10010219_11550 [Streptomyces netropsis]
MSGPAGPSRFQPVIDRTHCPYARASTWPVSEPARDGLPVEDHLERALPRFRQALRQVAAGEADGFVLDLPARLGADVATLRTSSLTATVAFGPDHTRYAFEAEGFFLLFQHESAFSRRHPGGIPMQVRDRIRHAFEEAGRPYRYDMGVVPVLRPGGDER